MSQQRQDESKRLAQHILAKEIVELAHGAAEAKEAESVHKEAFSHGTATISLASIRNSISGTRNTESLKAESLNKKEKALLNYKQAYAASASTQPVSGPSSDHSKNEQDNVVTLPVTMLQAGSFPQVLHAAGLATSKSEAHRLIAKRGAYVVLPNSGSPESSTALRWSTIEPGAAADPNHFLVDWEALVLRSGKSKIQICRVVTEEQFEAEGLTCIGWDEIKAKRCTESSSGDAED